MTKVTWLKSTLSINVNVKKFEFFYVLGSNKNLVFPLFFFPFFLLFILFLVCLFVCFFLSLFLCFFLSFFSFLSFFFILNYLIHRPCFITTSCPVLEIVHNPVLFIFSLVSNICVQQKTSSKYNLLSFLALIHKIICQLYVFVYLSLSPCMSLFLSQSLFLSIYLSLYQFYFLFLSNSLSLCLSVFVSVCLSRCLSVSLSFLVLVLVKLFFFFSLCFPLNLSYS